MMLKMYHLFSTYTVKKLNSKIYGCNIPIFCCFILKKKQNYCSRFITLPVSFSIELVTLRLLRLYWMYIQP